MGVFCEQVALTDGEAPMLPHYLTEPSQAGEKLLQEVRHKTTNLHKLQPLNYKNGGRTHTI